ncbi:hypothetical protein LJB42_001803 [Komagataella kurtzmanii]|nr:hypothetical protein LJB42_001803 [Komagataella kurtzmanii]
MTTGTQSSPQLTSDDLHKIDEYFRRHLKLQIAADNDSEHDQLPFFVGVTRQDFHHLKQLSLRKRRLHSDPTYALKVQRELSSIEKVEDKPTAYKTWASLLVKPSTNYHQNKLTKQDSPSNHIKQSASLPASSSQLSPQFQPLGAVLLRYMYDKDYQKPPDVKLLPHGLINRGNICYMNSVLQLFIFCKPLFRVLHCIREKTIAHVSGKSDTPILDALTLLLERFQHKESHESASVDDFGEPLSQESFYTSIVSLPKFSHLRWGQQEDAEEFMGYVLDELHEEFISHMAKLTDTEKSQLFASVNNVESKKQISEALNLIQKKPGSPPKSKYDTEDKHDDDGWCEVGSNNKLSAKRTVEVKPSPITEIFGGQFRSVLNVPRQKNGRSITLDPFLHVQLDISEPNVSSVEDAFTYLSQIEVIPYKSSNGNLVQATKQNMIDKLPEVLIIHLKRFSYVRQESSSDVGTPVPQSSSPSPSPSPSGSTQNGFHSKNNDAEMGCIQKIQKIIKFGHALTIPEACLSRDETNNEYQLQGVIYHHGNSTEGGHYTIDVKNDRDSWLRIDDTNIVPLTPQQVVGASTNDGKDAYILVYQKKN